MHVRDVLTGTAVACQWVFNGLVALLFPIAMAHFGSATFFVFAGINVLSLIFVATCLPETKGDDEQRQARCRDAQAAPHSLRGQVLNRGDFLMPSSMIDSFWSMTRQILPWLLPNTR